MEHYRLMVALRWSDLESLKVKDIPLKIHLQRLRKLKHRGEWCAVYDPPSGNESSGNGCESFRRFTERKASHVFGVDDDVSIIVCRKASSSLRRKAGEFATVVSVEPVSDSEAIPDSESDTPDLEPPPRYEEEAPKARGGPSLSGGSAASFGVRVNARQSRGQKRAASNNEYIKSRVAGLRKTREKLLGALQNPACDREKIGGSIRSVEAQISRLLNERSDVRSPTRGSKGGYEYPPPPNLDSHIRCRTCEVCGVCAHCRVDRGLYGSACQFCDELHIRYNRDLRPSTTQRPSWARAQNGSDSMPFPGERRIPRKTRGGSTVLFCGMCNAPLSESYCTNPCCSYWIRRQSGRGGFNGSG
jgi:hypothetical protein